jgi:hypothetical protein
VGLSRSLLQQYHRAVQQLLVALESVRELGGAQQQLLGGVVAACQKLRVANMQLEASRCVPAHVVASAWLTQQVTL